MSVSDFVKVESFIGVQVVSNGGEHKRCGEHRHADVGGERKAKCFVVLALVEKPVADDQRFSADFSATISGEAVGGERWQRRRREGGEASGEGGEGARRDGAKEERGRGG